MDSNDPWQNYEINEYSPDSLEISVNTIEPTSEGKSVLYLNVKNIGSKPINTYSINLTFDREDTQYASRSWVISIGPTLSPGEERVVITIKDELLRNESFWYEVTGSPSMVTPKYN